MLLAATAGYRFCAAANIVVIDNVIRRPVAQAASKNHTARGDIFKHGLNQHLIFRIGIGVGRNDMFNGIRQRLQICPFNIQQA